MFFLDILSHRMSVIGIFRPLANGSHFGDDDACLDLNRTKKKDSSDVDYFFGKFGSALISRIC